MSASAGLETLVVANVSAWREWLNANEDTSGGVWLVLAKKGTTDPTSLTYAQALDEALCSGWIDGQRRSNDDATFLQRYTPRRPRSIWSLRNVEHIGRLTSEGRMRPRGLKEVVAAKYDGRWDRAYAGAATAEIPDDLVKALDADRVAHAKFQELSGQDRYSHLHALMTAPNERTRQRRLTRIIQSLVK